MRIRIGIWDALTVLIVLATRWIVYALAPRSVLLEALAHGQAGHDLTGALVGIVTVAAGIAIAVLWLAALAVRERLALEGRRLVETPRLRPGPLAARAGALFLASSFCFAMTESTIHWRAGLGWHGLGCLLGPVHRDAIPILAALSLLTVAVHGAIEHLLAWARRLFAQPAPRRLVARPARPAAGCRDASRLPATQRRSGAETVRAARRAASSSPSTLAEKGVRRTVNVNPTGPRRLQVALACAVSTALVAAGAASAHARISPPVSLSNTLQLYSLAVPTEKAAPATTTKIVLTVPSGFSIDSFVPSPGWHRVLQQSGTGDSAVIQKVTWSGGHTPSGEDSLFQFLGQPAANGTYAFQVEQTYSDGSIVDWSGSESSANPAPTIAAKSSLGGGGTPLLTIIALVVGAVAVIIAAFALLAGGGGKRQLV